jgi:hypothetical protein
MHQYYGLLVSARMLLRVWHASNLVNARVLSKIQALWAIT